MCRSKPERRLGRNSEGRSYYGFEQQLVTPSSPPHSSRILYWMGHTDIHITLDTYADVFARMNAGAVEMLDTKMKDIVPVMLTDMDDDEKNLKHELYSGQYKSISAPHKDDAE